MFKKLYRNLLLLNVSVLSLLLIIIFSSLYLSTYFEIQDRIDFELEMLTVFSSNDPHNPDLFIPDRFGSFVIIVDDDGNAIDVISRLEYNTDFIHEVVDNASKDSGKLFIADYQWSYLKSTYNGNHVISVVNTTSDYEILRNTLITYFITFIISISITALISSLLTKKAIHPVKESFDKQKQFVSDASHELKTPLTVINTNVDILLEEQKDNKWLQYIKSEVTRMSKLTHDLLYLSNMTETHKNQVLTPEINVSEKLEGILLSIEALIFENNLHLDFEITPNLYIHFNNEQLHQLFMILLDNAIKYTNKEGNIHITLNESNNTCIFTIRNTGNGIESKHINHIFDRFYKVDESREEKSNSFGLGLPIAKKICEIHSAKISVTSEINNYTEFKVKF